MDKLFISKISRNIFLRFFWAKSGVSLRLLMSSEHASLRTVNLLMRGESRILPSIFHSPTGLNRDHAVNVASFLKLPNYFFESFIAKYQTLDVHFQ